METKPYNLQSPEQIAKDYGGNKKKIAEAMQMGIIDPTAGTLAAMFIDRMRSAAQMEAAPQQTVAQQLFAPPASQMPMGAPAGLGATPQAAAMPAPAAAPPMGMPSPQAAPGMAAGGMVPPYMAGGGLSSLPLPDGMFDEPSNGGFNDGYRGGGLVAFAKGDEVEEEDYVYSDKPGQIDETGTIVVDAPKKAPKISTAYLPGMMFKAPEAMGGYKNDLYGNLDVYSDAAPRETKEAEGYREYLRKMLDPEEQKKRRQEDMWMALGQLGAKMATTPGSLLQAASAGIGEALPGIAAAAKERRGEQRGVMQALVAEERTSNKEISDRADKALDMLKNYNSLNEAFQDRNFRNLWERMASADRRYVAQVAAAAGIQQSQIGAGAQIQVGQLGYNERRGALAQDIASNFDKNAALDPAYSDMLAKDPAKAAQYRMDQITTTLNRLMPALGGSNDPLGVRGGR